MIFLRLMLDAGLFSLFIPDWMKDLMKEKCKVWKTKDGRKISVKNLDDDHIVNIIKHLEKRNRISISLWNDAIAITGQVKMMNVTDEQFKVALVKGPSAWIDTLECEKMNRSI